MYKCSNCGKEFTLGGQVPDHSYGLKKGKPFVVVFCPECSNKLASDEKELIELKDANKKL